MSSARTVYRARDDATPESEVSVLASVYKLVISSHARKEATRPGSPDDAKEIKNDSRHCHPNT
jgi:hypothetical protein